MHPTETANLTDWIEDARTRTFDLIDDLTDEQLMGPQLDIVNPLLWEIGHVAWFFEKWVLQEAAQRPPVLDRSDELYDSIAIAHDIRWDLPLPTRQKTVDYVNRVLDASLIAVQADLTPELAYHTAYCVYHADMHTEAFTYTRQTHGLPFPATSHRSAPPEADSLSGDAGIDGVTFHLGASPDVAFCFDNEKWEHPVALTPYKIARTPVTQAEFAEFCDAGGYKTRSLWSEEGWEWRNKNDIAEPLYWKQTNGGWQRRQFDRWLDLEPDHPVIHVNWHEANAFCEWSGRRLPSEAEWEAAASLSRFSDTTPLKREYPWGDCPKADAVHTDWAGGGTVHVGAYIEGDAPSGCRQMVGNVWEWTRSAFRPYPGFEIDPYKEYSEPWFETRKVLRGGSWATRGRMLWNTWRNFMTPDRRDIFAGFRTCAK